MNYIKIIHICNWTVFCLVLNIIVGCDNQTDRIQVPIIDLSQKRDTINFQLNEIAKRIQYVELESNLESFIGEISDVVFSDNYIAILDQKQQKVFLFNSDGKFIRVFEPKGKDPREYCHAFSIEIGEEEGYIYVHSTGDKILKYTSEGEFDSNISTNGAKFQYFKLTNGDLLLAIPYPLSQYYEGYTFGILDSKGQVINRILKRKNKIKVQPEMMICNSSFYSLDDTIVYWQYIYDTIYSITPEYLLKPRWVLKYGENAVPPNAFNNIADVNREKRLGKFMVTNIIESNKNIFFSAIGNRYRELIIYNKVNQALFNLSNTKAVFFGLENNVDGGPSFWPEYLINDSTMVAILSPEKLINLRLNQYMSLKTESSVFRDIVDRATVRTNHVIMKISLK